MERSQIQVQGDTEMTSGRKVAIRRDGHAQTARQQLDGGPEEGSGSSTGDGQRGGISAEGTQSLHSRSGLFFMPLGRWGALTA